MTQRMWIRKRYFNRVVANAVCDHCHEPFEYVRTSKPKKYCGRYCAHEMQLKQMRICNEFIRNLDKAARTA